MGFLTKGVTKGAPQHGDSRLGVGSDAASIQTQLSTPEQIFSGFKGLLHRKSSVASTFKPGVDPGLEVNADTASIQTRLSAPEQKSSGFKGLLHRKSFIASRFKPGTPQYRDPGLEMGNDAASIQTQPSIPEQKFSGFKGLLQRKLSLLRRGPLEPVDSSLDKANGTTSMEQLQFSSPPAGQPPYSDPASLTNAGLAMVSRQNAEHEVQLIAKPQELAPDEQVPVPSTDSPPQMQELSDARAARSYFDQAIPRTIDTASIDEVPKRSIGDTLDSEASKQSVRAPPPSLSSQIHANLSHQSLSGSTVLVVEKLEPSGGHTIRPPIALGAVPAAVGSGWVSEGIPIQPENPFANQLHVIPDDSAHSVRMKPDVQPGAYLGEARGPITAPLPQRDDVTPIRSITASRISFGKRALPHQGRPPKVRRSADDVTQTALVMSAVVVVSAAVVARLALTSAAVGAKVIAGVAAVGVVAFAGLSMVSRR